MRICFLSATVPLTKTFTRHESGAIEGKPYPLVKNVTSYYEEVANIKEMFTALQSHALQSHCLLRGRLVRPVHNESRAGLTDTGAPTQWVVFDLDGIPGYESIEDFIKTTLPSEFHNCSYISQLSSSSGITKQGISAHVYFFLGQLVMPGVLKEWVTSLNLDIQTIKDAVTLNATKKGLNFPLDRSVCDNTKLIYIAPPICEGFDDPIANERIRLVEKSEDWVTYKFPPPAAASNQSKIDDLVDALRAAEGLKKQKARYKMIGDQRLLVNPDRAVVTGIKEERGFVYLNLNGGDSWGYFYHKDRPEILYNFKNEPCVKLAQIVPDYYQSNIAKQLMLTGERVLAFHETRQDAYYIGRYRTDTLELIELHKVGAKDRLADYCENHNAAPPDPVPEWRLVFDPTSNQSVDPDAQVVNQWRPTHFLKEATDTEDGIPPVIRKVLLSVVGDCEETLEHLMNWLGFIFQRREKTLTSWVFHGCQGTGKGIMFSNILSPIFGYDYCVTKQLRDLDDRFNDYLETAILMNLDEVKISESPSARRTVNQLKHMITEPMISIRAMRQSARMERSFTNFMFMSNDLDAMEIDPGDRRFNVAPRQEKMIQITEDEIDAIVTELPIFANFLHSYKVNVRKAKRPLQNVAKAAMREASMNSVDQLFDAIRRGDLEFFTANMDTFVGGQEIKELERWHKYQEIVRRWIAHAVGHDGGCPVTKSDLLHVYTYLQAPRQVPGPNQFVRMLKHKNIFLSPTKGPDRRTVRAYLVHWNATKDQLESMKEYLSKEEQLKLIIARDKEEQPSSQARSMVRQ